MESQFTRNIRSGAEYDKYFPKPNFQEENFGEGRVIGQTIQHMREYIIKYQSDTAKIAKILKGKTIEETLRNNWNFVYKHIQYKIDTPGREELRRPAMSWAQRSTGVDCDCYTIFLSTLLLNQGIQPIIRIVKIPPAPSWHHVYPIVKNRQGGHYVLDCVLDKFNYEKPFGSSSNKKDFTMDGLGIPIIGLNGYSDSTAQDIENLLGTLDGSLGTTDAMLNHIIATRNIIAKDPSAYETGTNNAILFLKELDYAIEHWNTPLRDLAIEKLAERESLHGLGSVENESSFEAVNNIASLDRAIEMKLMQSRNTLADAKSNDKIQALNSLIERLSAIQRLNTSQKEIAIQIIKEINQGLPPSGETEEFDLIEDYIDSIEDIEDDILLMEQSGLQGLELGAFWNKRSKRLEKRKARQTKRLDKAVKKGKTKKVDRLKKSVEKTSIKQQGKAEWKDQKKAWNKENDRGFWNGVKKGSTILLKQANPVFVTIRAGLLMAIGLNMFKLKNKLKWSYATSAQAQKNGMSTGKHKSLQKALKSVDKIWKSIGGDPNKLKKAILHGKKGSIDGLGNPAAAAPVVAAIPFITKIMNVIKKAGAFAKESGVTKLLTNLKNKKAITNADIEASQSAIPSESMDNIPIENEIQYSENDNDQDIGATPFYKSTGVIIAGIGTLVLGAIGIVIYKTKNEPAKQSLTGPTKVKTIIID